MGGGEAAACVCVRGVYHHYEPGGKLRAGIPAPDLSGESERSGAPSGGGRGQGCGLFLCASDHRLP